MKQPRDVTPALLRRCPLPPILDGGKEERGRLLVIAGSSEVPGAAVLAAEAGLRAGAGKVAVAAPAPLALGLGLALPDVRVMALPQVSNREVDKHDAIVIGPGMEAKDAVRCRKAVLGSHASLLIDAAALSGLWRRDALREGGLGDRCILTPHTGELARMARIDEAAIRGNVLAAAQEAAQHLGALIVLKAGATTAIASLDQGLFRHYAKAPGLGISGSGDVLAGLIGGLLARGAAPLHAALWGVLMHARAGSRLGRRMGVIGYRAGEIAREIPSLLQGLGKF